MQARPQHPWQFFRAGGVDQVIIRTGADIAHLPELDQKLWVALACPTRGIEFDTRTLDLIDTDHDGRIRPPELLAACAWACSMVRDPEELAQPSEVVMLDALADTDEGRALAAQARRILELAGRADATSIDLATVSQRAEVLSEMRFNGDGVVSPETAADDALARQTIRWIMQLQGEAKAVDDQPAGVDRERAEAFFTQVRKLRQWADGARSATAHLPLGEGTLDATLALNAVRSKIDDFFARARLAAYDLRAASALNPSKEEYAAMAEGDLEIGRASCRERV